MITKSETDVIVQVTKEIMNLEWEYFNQRLTNIIESQVNMTENLVYNNTFD